MFVPVQTGSSPTVFFASPLEAEHIDRIHTAYPSLTLLVPDGLWPQLRYVADHTGAPREFTRTEEEAWLAMLARADILFDFDRRHLANLPALAPRLRWIQSTSAGVVHYVEQSGVDQAGIVVTTASGVHAVPLAEWAVFAVLWHEKRAPLLAELRRDRRWDRFCGGEALGKRALVLGYGAVGKAIGQYLTALGIEVYGLASRGLVAAPKRGPLQQELAAVAATGGPGVGPLLDFLLPATDYLVVALPGTPATVGMLPRRRLELLPATAMVINVGRGSVLDEQALTEMLAAGRIASAALDVFVTEPLPGDSPLWEMPNVLINPHSASTSDRENGRITDIFLDNLGRYLRGEPLRNVYQPERGY